MAAAVAPSERERRDGLFERIAELLEVTYRSADLGNLEDPLDEAITRVLSLELAS